MDELSAQKNDESDIENSPIDGQEKRRHSFYKEVPLARRMQEGAWGGFQSHGRRSLERLKTTVSSSFMGRPIHLYVFVAIIIGVIVMTIISVEFFLRPSWAVADELDRIATELTTVSI